jgi:ABC-type branched-subunit amino acid transport system substrate-binding protein
MTHKSSSLMRLLALLAALLLLAGACGRDDEDEAVDTGADDTAQGEDDAPKQLTNGPGFDGTTIKVGALTPQTGPVAGPIGIPLTDGNKLFVDKINAKGGIAGKYKLELVVADNAYSTDQTKTKYKEIKDQVVMFAQILGTPPTSAVLVDLKTDRIMASPASLDAEWVSEEVLLPVGGPYQIQIINGANWALNEGGAKGKPICIFAADDAYGEAGIQGLQFASKELNFTVAATTRYNAAPGSSTDFTAQVTQMKDAQCNTVFVVATPAPANALLTKAQQLGFEPQYFLGQSPSWVAAFAASPLWQKNYHVLGDSPEWGDESVTGMKEMLADVKQFRPDQKPDGYFIFGYNQMRAVVAVLEEAVKRGDLSREGIITASKRIGTVDFGDLTGDFKYGAVADREPPRATYITKVNAATPGGLDNILRVESPAAKKYKFEK